LTHDRDPTRVLIFAYYFPPLGGGGVQRTLKFVKYLPSEGFQSIVVSGSRRGYALRDSTLLREIPAGTIVSRARALPLQQAQWKLDALFRRLGLPTGLLNQVLWPDPLVGWLPAAVRSGLRAVRVHRPTVLFSTSKPETSHLAALIVHRITGLPWVADFRDSWTRNPHDAGLAAPSALRRASAALENTVLREAAYATVACESVQLPALTVGDPRRVHIPNGVDPDDLPTLAPSPARTDRFRLAHVGSLYGARNAAPVFAAIGQLIAEGKLEPSRFEFRAIGHATLNGTAPGSIPTTFAGYVDHQRAVAEMANASTLLFYQPADELGSSGKIYEYLASGRRILCVANPRNSAYRLVRELNAGDCVDARDVDSVAAAVHELVGAWSAGDDLTVDPRVRELALTRFSRRELTGELARLLRSAAAGGRGRATTGAALV
jgi:glycosyltransferase involved in cell wall biosynthesis